MSHASESFYSAIKEAYEMDWTGYTETVSAMEVGLQYSSSVPKCRSTGGCAHRKAASSFHVVNSTAVPLPSVQAPYNILTCEL